jgi:stage II sporulation protein B
MNKARITYRFDQSRPPQSDKKTDVPKGDKVIPLSHEEFQVVEGRDEAADKEWMDKTKQFKMVESVFEPQTLNQFTTDFGGWNSPFENDDDRVEHVIRATNAETVDTETGYYQPPRSGYRTNANGPLNWTEPQTGYIRSSSTPWFRIATSIAGAVITGIAFGFFVLSMFSGGSGDNTQTVGNTTAPAAAKVQGQGGAAVEASKNAAVPAAPTASAVRTTQVSVAAKSYSFLQNGVFSSDQSADAALADLKKKGLASALEQGEKKTIYIGFAQNRDDALGLSHQLQEKKLEVYIKSMDLPAVSSIRWSGTKPESIGSYFAQGDKLIETISGLTLMHLAETAPTTLEDSAMQSIRSAHQVLIALTASVNEGASETEKAQLQKMTTALNSAVQSMEEYKKNPSTAMLWQAQSSLMNYILVQRDLLKMIAG